MYVKEDLIIPQVMIMMIVIAMIIITPQTNTFYDFIVSRARGKSGPLFNFDVKVSCHWSTVIQLSL